MDQHKTHTGNYPVHDEVSLHSSHHEHLPTQVTTENAAPEKDPLKFERTESEHDRELSAITQEIRDRCRVLEAEQDFANLVRQEGWMERTDKELTRLHGWRKRTYDGD